MVESNWREERPRYCFEKCLFVDERHFTYIEQKMLQSSANATTAFGSLRWRYFRHTTKCKTNTRKWHRVQRVQHMAGGRIKNIDLFINKTRKYHFQFALKIDWSW